MNKLLLVSPAVSIGLQTKRTEANSRIHIGICSVSKALRSSLKCPRRSFYSCGLFAVFYFRCDLFKSDACVDAVLPRPHRNTRVTMLQYLRCLLLAVITLNVWARGEQPGVSRRTEPLSRQQNPWLTAAAGCNIAPLTAGGRTTVHD